LRSENREPKVLISNVALSDSPEEFVYRTQMMCYSEYLVFEESD